MKIKLPPSNGENLKTVLEKNGIYINSPCGGNGKCGKCKVLILNGETSPRPDEKGYVLACHTKLITECEILLPESDYIFHSLINGKNLQDCGNFNTVSEEYKPSIKSINFSSQQNNQENVSFDNENIKYAVCDIGTTNVKIRKFEGNKISECFFKNPQFPFGGDVISRIANSKNGGYITQCKLIRDAILSRIGDVDLVYICGNPTMMHIFACVDPSPIGVYPFKCVFTETKYLSKSETNLPFDVILLPSSSAYIGSDAVVGVSMLWEKEKNILIADLGTNGEISLIKGGEVYSASTAAGPAIEGANMEMGVCDINNVVSFVDENGMPHINGDKAKGINALGVFSLISYLLKTKKLTSEGRFELCTDEKIIDNKYYITENVYLSQNDISEFMLAKSAVKTAIVLLLRETDTSFSDIDKLVLTGGLSTDISADIFARIGLIPKELKEKAVYIPNLAITATEKCVNREYLKFVENLSEKIITLPLNENPLFEEEFISNIFFDD